MRHRGSCKYSPSFCSPYGCYFRPLTGLLKTSPITSLAKFKAGSGSLRHSMREVDNVAY
ncbi:UNVERIFIED_CONTAM: hypothetical protein Slati_2102300 [Sesamum latifolium]|uniref:Uncharacterized protein n=1 Tax=Sesamum latifolium TaxID=2727402 RepID=A0AAW2WRC1_9LAMI